MTEEALDLIGVDETKYGRRYFPQTPMILQKGSSLSQESLVPHCTSNVGRVGCVVKPRSTQSDAPLWAGKIHSTPPFCNTRKGECNQEVPASRKVHNFSEALIPIIPSSLESVLMVNDLPGGAFQTESFATADVNGDGWIDIIIGNRLDEPNQLLINNGDGTFGDAIHLPGGVAMYTTSISLADVNGDNSIDIIVGNNGQTNQILINNGDGSYSEEGVIDLPGGNTTITSSISVADVNCDGWIDIIIGNQHEPNQILINDGKGGYIHEVITLPDSASNTISIRYIWQYLGDLLGHVCDLDSSHSN